ncbi:MAG: CYTH domain-containing protein [Gammaproteobacteria bacterium]|jgi:inorganic triphosphatase YgiF
MNTEIELKFTIAPTEIVKLNKHLLIQQYLQQQYQLKLENIYFDTPNLTLKKKNYALRIRKYGNHILQTLKTDQKINNELHERQEWEYEIKTEQIDSDQFPAEIQQWLKPLINQLKPIFTTNFERKIWLIKLEDKTIIELALDQGKIKTGDKTLPICEIELELKQGELESMLQFARKLQQDIRLIPEKTSKAERGYELL